MNVLRADEEEMMPWMLRRGSEDTASSHSLTHSLRHSHSLTQPVVLVQAGWQTAICEQFQLQG